MFGYARNPQEPQPRRYILDSTVDACIQVQHHYSDRINALLYVRMEDFPEGMWASRAYAILRTARDAERLDPQPADLP